MLEIEPRHLRMVLNILASLVPAYEVRAFGSRVTGTAKPHSDLDLVIMTEQPLPVRQLARLRQAFSESRLPFKVDLVDWSATADNFQKIILSNCELIQNGSSRV